MEALHKTIPKQLTIALLCLVLVAVSTFWVNLILARLLTPIQYGDFSVAIRVIGFCSLITMLGVDRAALKVLPESTYLKKWGEVKGYLRWSLLVILISSLIVIVIILSMVGLLELLNRIGFIKFDYRHPVISVIWLIPLVATSLFLSKVLMSRGQISASLLPHKMIRPLIAALGVFLIVALTGFASAHHALFIYGAASIFIIAILLFIVFRKLPSQVRYSKSEVQHKLWLGLSIQLMIIKVIPLAVTISELILLEVIAPNEGDVGIFSAIITLILFIWLSYKALIVVISPKISTATASGRIDDLKKALVKSSWCHIAVSALITVFIVIYAKPLLHFFGPTYIKGVAALRVMSIGDFIGNSFRPSELVLQYGGYPKIVSKVVVLSFSVGVALTAILITQYGLLGAAIGYAFTRLTQALLSTIYCMKKLRIFSLMRY